MEKKAAPTRNMTMLAPVTERERKSRNGHQRRVSHLELDVDEHGQQHGRHPEDGQGVGRAPGMGIGADDGVNQRAQPGGDGDGAPDVELGGVGPALVPACFGQVHQRGQRRGRRRWGC